MTNRGIISVMKLVKEALLEPNFEVEVTALAGSDQVTVADPGVVEVGMIVAMGSRWSVVRKVQGSVVFLAHPSMETVAPGRWSFGYGLETALRAACADEGVALSAIRKWAFLDTKESMGRQFPMVEILPRRSDTDYLSEEAPAIGSDAWEYHLLDVTVSDSGNDTEKVSTAVLLYREALRVLVEADNTIGGGVNRIQLKGADYSDMLKLRDQDTFLQIMTQTIEVRV